MDRTLRIIQDGCPLAQLVFTYQTPTTGEAIITVNKIIEVAPGIYATEPLYLKRVEVTQSAMHTIAEVKAFDLNFLREQIETPSGIANSMQLEYIPVHYRYLINVPAIAAIVDIRADFAADKKELSLVSASRIIDDTTGSGHSIEINVDFVKRIFGQGKVRVDLVDTR